MTMLGHFAQDMKKLAHEGCDIGRGRRMWVVCVGALGDWPAHKTSAGLNRSWANCPKHPSSKEGCGGICHLCMAGFEDPNCNARSIPYEDFTLFPEWLASAYQCHECVNAEACTSAPPDYEIPWDEDWEPPELAMPQYKFRPYFFRPDFWHNTALGGCKSWSANFCVCFLSLSEGSNVDEQFEFQTSDFNTFCAARNHKPYIKELTKDKMSWPQSSCWPEGSWHKGDFTTCLMLWAESFGERMLQRHKCTDELLITLAAYSCYNSHDSIFRLTSLC